MNELLKDQIKSKASKICQVIRESMEFSKELLQNSDEEDINENDLDDLSQDDYESSKYDDALRIIQRKLDMKQYKKQVKNCKKIVLKGEAKHPIGTAYKSLLKAHKNILQAKSSK